MMERSCRTLLDQQLPVRFPLMVYKHRQYRCVDDLAHNNGKSRKNTTHAHVPFFLFERETGCNPPYRAGLC